MKVEVGKKEQGAIATFGVCLAMTTSRAVSGWAIRLISGQAAMP
jgi:hypothetical protein